MTLQINPEQIQLLINLLASAQEQQSTPVVTFEEQVQTRAQQVVRERIERMEKRLEPFERVNACFFLALEPHIGEAFAKFVVDSLDEGRRTNNYSTMVKVYAKIAKDMHRRNMIKAVSAIYRKHFCSPDKRHYRYQMDSIIKYATACPHCGDLAQKVQTYLDANFPD